MRPISLQGIEHFYGAPADISRGWRSGFRARTQNPVDRLSAAEERKRPASRLRMQSASRDRSGRLGIPTSCIFHNRRLISRTCLHFAVMSVVFPLLSESARKAPGVSAQRVTVCPMDK
jgi:hypothetical protein